MRIPIWLAAVLVTAAFGAAGVAFEHMSHKVELIDNDIVALKVDVAAIKSRMDSRVALATPGEAFSPGQIYPTP